MAKKVISDTEVVQMVSKASTPGARESQVIAKAYDLAERRIMEGTASDTLIREFIKLGSPKEQIEQTWTRARTDPSGQSTDRGYPRLRTG